MELLARCTRFVPKIKAMIASKVPDGQQSRPKLGRKPLQPSPAIYMVHAAQLFHKHMIDNVFENDGEIKTLLMTASDSTIHNRATDLLKMDSSSSIMRIPQGPGLCGGGSTAPQVLGPNVFRNAGHGRGDEE